MKTGSKKKLPNTKIRETLIDRLYRYNYEKDGICVQQDFPTQQDMKVLAERYSLEVDKSIEEKGKIERIPE